MSVLLEFKQKLKNFYSKNEVYFLPFFKFGIAISFFYWITRNLGFMTQITSIYVLLVLALICCILPSSMMVLIGFLLILGHAYAICLEAAAFSLVLMLFLALLFLRFCRGQSAVLVCTPLAFTLDIPALLPIGSALLGNALTVFPAATGVIIYYYVRSLSASAETLRGAGLEILDKVRLLADNLVQNWAMWLTIVAFVVTILLVNLIRTRSFDHAWKVAIFSGGVSYILVMLGGSYLLENVTVSMEPLLIQAGISVLVGLIMEFLFFGGDYSRTERLEYEDDEYYYYVKAVPKAAVPASERNIKRITSIQKDDYRYQEQVSAREKRSSRKKREEENFIITVEPEEDNSSHVDFEKKLEESLKDL